MITVTESAVERLLELLERSGAEHGETFRLALNSDGLTLRMGVPRQADRVISKEGRAIVAIDSRTESVMEDATVETTGDGKTLRLVRHGRNGHDGSS